MLIAGTELGEIFCFLYELGNDRKSIHLRLKFRDVLRRRIVSLFVMEIEKDNPQICVLEDTGRLTTFDVLRKPQNDGFLGRRTNHHVIAAGATAATPTSDGRLLVAGWDTAAGHGWLRLVSFRDKADSAFRSWDRPKEIKHAVEQVLSKIRGTTDAIASDDDRQMALDVLASFPLNDAALRKVLIRDRVALAWNRREWHGPIKALLTASIQAHEGGREELKSLLEEVDERLRDTPADQQANRFKALHDLFIKPRTLTPGRRDSRMQATIVRRVLTARTLSLWPRGEEDILELQNWIERHLQHSEPFVRVDTLRALSEALLTIIRAKKRGDRRLFDQVFPSSPGSPAIFSAGWLLESISRFLYSTRPSRAAPSAMPGTLGRCVGHRQPAKALPGFDDGDLRPHQCE